MIKSAVSKTTKKSNAIKTCFESLSYFRGLLESVESEYDHFEKAQDTLRSRITYGDLRNLAEKRLEQINKSYVTIQFSCKNVEISFIKFSLKYSIKFVNFQVKFMLL